MLGLDHYLPYIHCTSITICSCGGRGAATPQHLDNDAHFCGSGFTQALIPGGVATYISHIMKVLLLFILLFPAD